MQPTTLTPRPPRSAVLVVSHGDGYTEVYGPAHVDIHLARVPVTHSREAETTAEDVAELLMPLRYRALYRRDYLRAVGSTRPLLPSVLADSLYVRDVLAALDTLTGAYALQEEVTAWT